MKGGEGNLVHIICGSELILKLSPACDRATRFSIWCDADTTGRRAELGLVLKL